MYGDTATDALPAAPGILSRRPNAAIPLMPHRSALLFLRLGASLALLLSASLLECGSPSSTARATELRHTPVVRAVERARPSVVNIHGQKTLGAKYKDFNSSGGSRRVNGMGTGVVIDERGYIITNFHVVDGVRRIQVTLASGKTYVARLISHDRPTDLAIIKIDTPGGLPVITIGTSKDLMVGEPTIAVGNAYGYEHTVTEGIISSLHRTVNVSDTQVYADQIQTSAGINPGNSGGPLMNIDGEMIGINVAVRAGAQNIAFAIPVDKVMEITAKLLSIERLDNHWHGVVAKATSDDEPFLVVERVVDDSPAEKGGLRPGDRIMAIDSHKIERMLDIERALLGLKRGTEVEVAVERNNQPMTLSIVMAPLPRRHVSVNDRAWKLLGVRLNPIPSEQFQSSNDRYRGGLTVTQIRPGSPADRQNIRRGDILVGLHVWETTSLKDVSYVLNWPDLSVNETLKFYILRGEKTFFGHLSVASHTTR